MLDEDGFFTISLRSLGRQHVHARTSFRRRSVRVQPRRRGDVDRSQAADDLLRALFPDVVPTDLATGLRATAEWFERARPWEADHA